MRWPNIVLKILALVLLTSAALKGWHLLIEPTISNSFFTSRIFQIFVVEFELALAIWLLSGIFKTAAHLTTLACFGLFSIITIYLGITGADSCGCFGPVKVNPWLTLLAMDIPAVIALLVFRPKIHLPTRLLDLKATISHILSPLPTLPRLTGAFSIGLSAVLISTTVLALNQPPRTTSTYEILEPETWIGKPLPVLDYIDIADQLKTGNWLIMLYNHSCSSCAEALTQIEQISRDLAGNEDILQIAIIQIPPYATNPPQSQHYKTGKLADMKQWFITTSATLLIQNNNVSQTWKQKNPNLTDILELLFK